MKNDKRLIIVSHLVPIEMNSTGPVFLKERHSRMADGIKNYLNSTHVIRSLILPCGLDAQILMKRYGITVLMKRSQTNLLKSILYSSKRISILNFIKDFASPLSGRYFTIFRPLLSTTTTHLPPMKP